MTTKYSISQELRKGPGYPEKPAHVRISAYSPTYGWRVTSSFDKVFPTHDEAQAWIDKEEATGHLTNHTDPDDPENTPLSELPA